MPVAATSPRIPGRACRFCGAALAALEALRGDVCGALDCRRRAGDALARERRERRAEELLSAAAREPDAAAPAGAPVLWLQRHPDGFDEPPRAELEALRGHLQALQSCRPDLESPAPDVAWSPAAGAAAGHLCTLCRGRCCRLGLPHKAFLARRDLQDWLDGHEGATWSDAVGFYVRHVPDRHLSGSCLFHGETGCTLPRERRSDVCNRHVCDTLGQLRDRLDQAPGAAAVVGVDDAHGLHGGALVSARELRALPLPRPAYSA